MNPALVGFWCLAALVMWKSTRERWFPALVGLLIVAVTLTWAARFPFPVDIFIVWGGMAVLALAAYGLKRYDKFKGTPPVFPPSEPESKTLELTTEELNAKSGWERWEITSATKRLDYELCLGGPPVWRRKYEYEVRDKTILVRLIESSKDAFDGPEYEVFDRSVIQEQVERDYKTDADRWKDAEPEIQALMAPPIADRIANLQKQIVWHELKLTKRQSGEAVHEFILKSY
jgi:hypothetical protein